MEKELIGSLDINKLKSSDSKKDYSYDVFYASQIKTHPNEVVIRIMPPNPNLDGLFYYEAISYFYNGRGKIEKYFSPKTLSSRAICPFEEEILIAKSKYSNDPAIIEKIEKIGKPRKEYFTNIILLDPDTLKLASGEDSVRIFSYGPLIRQKLVDIATNKRADGKNMATFEKGVDIVLSKHVKSKLSVDYSVTPALPRDITEIMPSFVLDLDTHPDIKAYIRSKINHPEYYRNVIRNILYDEPLHKNLCKASYDDFLMNKDISHLYDADLEYKPDNKKDDIKKQVDKINSPNTLLDSNSDDFSFANNITFE